MAAGPTDTAGDLLLLIRTGRARTRAQLARASGMSRSTVTQRVEALLASGLVYEDGEAPSSGGRPPRTLAFRADAGVVLVADLGATHARIAVANLVGELLAEHTSDLAIGRGPDTVLAWVRDRFRELLVQAGRSGSDVRGIGVGVPGPVEYQAGRAVSPPIMPGWDQVRIPPLLQDEWDVPVLVDNDVNIMALGEYHSRWRDKLDTMLFVKVGAGIGSGIVVGGRVQRGEQGAAGDIGHVRVDAPREVLCACGNIGCLEAVAGGRAMARRLTRDGVPAEGALDVARLAREGNTKAVQLVRAAGRELGEVLAGVVNLLNPGAIVLGGDVAEAADVLMAGVRQRVYERSTALATRGIVIERSPLGARVGAVGAAVMVTESILHPRAVDQFLQP